MLRAMAKVSVGRAHMVATTDERYGFRDLFDLPD